MPPPLLNLVVIRAPDIESAHRFYSALGLSFTKHAHGKGPTHLSCEEGSVVFETWDMGLPHVEFVKRRVGDLPAGAWVGTASKIGGEVVAISSKHFYGYQLPAPE